ncbi:MAG TPA: alkyl hydroperoxide reductase [Planctomycetaceae bacterium]|nr:alkyl hydroperoxide reductase [Planctomycetaceae bacterium]
MNCHSLGFRPPCSPFVRILLVAAAIIACTEPLARAVESTAETPTEEASGDTPAGHSYHGEAFNAGPRQAAVLLPGMGNVDLKTSAKDQKTQAFINQGVAALHGFWYLEAERSFRQAAMLEPDLAIAYWGMALANANNESRARDFIAEAVKRRDAATRREQMYIDALSNYLTKPEKPPKDHKVKREKQYIEELEKLVDEFPEDVEARALLALRMWMGRKEVPIISNHAVNALMSEVFAINPLHPAHHYRIHLWDGPKPKNALESAALCGQSLPGIAHMWHMPGHIYSKLNRYHDAVWQQEASARADHAHMVQTRLMPDQIHNFSHNNEWLVRNLLFLGHVNDAIVQSKNLIAMPRHPEYNSHSKRGSYRYGRIRLIQTLTEYELWDQLITEANGPFFDPTHEEETQHERLAWLTVAYHLTGSKEEAARTVRPLERLRIQMESQILDLEEGLEAVKAEDRKADKRTDELGKAKTKLKELKGHLAKCDAAAAVAAKDATQAKLAIDRASGIEDVLAASWIGQAGDHAGAIEKLEKLLASRPAQVRPLAILIDQLWKADRKDDAVKHFETLRKVGGTADLATPLLTRIKPVVEKAGAPEDWRITPEPAGDIGQRPELDSLGPAVWAPYTSPQWQVQTADDNKVTDDAYQGKAKIIVFYLGFGCLHCVEQLKAINPQVAALKEAGIEVLAISTETLEELQKGIAGYGSELPITIMADPEKQAFKAFRCWDDFESQPLHGTFLIDTNGQVRWQDIGHEPFNKIDFLLEESKRLLAIPEVKIQ